MEKLADISEPQVPPNEQKINKFNFPPVIQFQREKLFSSQTRGKIEFIDLFAHLAELEVLKYLPSFPYWFPKKPRKRHWLELHVSGKVLRLQYFLTTK